MGETGVDRVDVRPAPRRAPGRMPTLPAGGAPSPTPRAPPHLRPRDRGLVWAFQHRPAVYGIMALYGVASTVLMATRTVGVTAEHALLLTLLVAVMLAPARPFVWDWLPFLFVGVMFEDLAPLTSHLLPVVHVGQPIGVERDLLGGSVAVTTLQGWAGTAGHLHWYDVLLALEYLAHFAAPPLAAFWLWTRYRRRFGAFVSAYILMMASGFAIYLMYPEMPPWLASQHGALPPVRRVVVDVLNWFPGLGRLYASADPEPNGAMPALHISVPILIAATWFAVHGPSRVSSWISLLYPVTIVFGTLYLGEHYLVDDVVGAGIGVGCFLVAEVAYRRSRLRLVTAGPTAVAPPGARQ